MTLGLLVESIAFVLAVAGLLLQPKRDPSAPPSWSNLSRMGKLILVLILAAGSAKMIKMVRDGRAQAAQRAAQQTLIDRQNQELRDLKETNQHLIKVMSVAGGYNARVEGVVTFARPVSDGQIREALRNLFLKFALIEIEASNRLGEYRGRVDYGAHPELFRYLWLARVNSESMLIPNSARVTGPDLDRSYYFELRCANLKILNPQRIQYAQFDNDPPVRAKVLSNPYAWKDFHTLYGIKRLTTFRLTLEELGEVTLAQRVELINP
jgi:hypothetical protein